MIDCDQYEDLYENPSSMETQGDALGHHSDPPSVGSTEDPIDADLRNSPEAYVVPEPTYPTILPLFGPLPDPANRDFDPFNADDNMTAMFDSEPNNYESGDISSANAESGKSYSFFFVILFFPCPLPVTIPF